MGSIIGHTGFNVARYYLTHVFGGLFPLCAGLLVFGWRAGISVLLVIVSTLMSGLIWRRIGSRGRPLRPVQLLWFGMVLALMMPASLLQFTGTAALWPLLPAAGLLLVIVCWTLGGAGSGRVHPVAVVYVLLALGWPIVRHSDLLLQRNRLLVGDLLAAPVAAEPRSPQDAWRRRTLDPVNDALRIIPPTQRLLRFTRTERTVDGSAVSLDTLLRDHLPPMEDLVLGAQPGGIGMTSAIAIIVGGLFLLFRGLIDYRIPLLIVASAWIALLVLPIPWGLQQPPAWHWLPGHLPHVGWAMGITLANYQLLASPLLFTAFFLAGSPTVRPLTRRGRAIYALLIGVLAAVLQMYVSVTLGSCLAVLIVGAISPLLDKCAGCRSLVPVEQ
jgi:Na+-translocating ferredoxin:NAD+ oxidoreductase RnfD subunit